MHYITINKVFMFGISGALGSTHSHSSFAVPCEDSAPRQQLVGSQAYLQPAIVVGGLPPESRRFSLVNGVHVPRSFSLPPHISPYTPPSTVSELQRDRVTVGQQIPSPTVQPPLTRAKKKKRQSDGFAGQNTQPSKPGSGKVCTIYGVVDDASPPQQGEWGYCDDADGGDVKQEIQQALRGLLPGPDRKSVDVRQCGSEVIEAIKNQLAPVFQLFPEGTVVPDQIGPLSISERHRVQLEKCRQAACLDIGIIVQDKTNRR